jgi:endonuclease YncB( thermonuclease family)
LALLAALIAAGLVTIDLLLPRSGLPQRISGGSRTQKNGGVALDAPAASSKMPQPLDSASLRRNLPHQFSIEPPYEVQDGITFKSGRRVIRMAGVRGVDRDAVCTGETGTLWACGQQARVALHNATRMQSFVCVEVARDPTATLANCRNDSTDLARVLIADGWALPAETGSSEYLAELADARSRKRGAWNGYFR